MKSLFIVLVLATATLAQQPVHAPQLRDLESTVRTNPNNETAVRELAHLYALTILKGGPPAELAQAGLDASKNVWVIGNAAYMFQSQYNWLLQMGTPNPRAAQLAEQYFLRAKALDPNLDRAKILPQIDLADIARQQRERDQAARDWAARAAIAVSEIRRLPVEAFPDVPPAIAAVLRARHCTVPQPAFTGPPRNLIQGQFHATGETGWAVLCSVNHSTTLLVFRSAGDTRPQTLNTSDDLNYMQGLEADQIGYSRQITPVSRDYILTHAAYGGPKPPPIDHQGIDDAFLEKASGVLYFHNGKWLQLAGAD
ncbi:MAG: hypothetical protein ABI693_00815 [Bryobacteraceae bacterium]